jgi:tRNA-2-methylthio-N6-dimethylallyladenosine synthase
MRLIEEVGFDSSFSFVFSPRPGTPAANLHDETPQEIKLARLRRLQAAIENNAQAIARAMEGTEQRVLVDARARKNERELSGRTDNNRVVNFAGPDVLLGRFIAVQITQALPHSLRGRLLPA